MKKTNIDEKLELERKLVVAEKTIVQLENVGELKRIANQKEFDHRSFIDRNKMWIDFSSTYKIEERENLQREAIEARKRADEVEARYTALKKEVADLSEQLSRIEYNASIEEVLESQHEVVRIQSEIGNIEEVISRHEQKQSELLTGSGSSLDMLTEQREKALANLALGEPGNEKELKSLDRKIADEEKAHFDLVESSIQIAHAINGLNVKLSGKKEELVIAKKYHSENLAAFLMQERKSSGEHYAELAIELSRVVSRIVGFDEMLKDFAIAAPAFKTWESNQFEIPMLNLPSCRSAINTGRPGLMFVKRQLDKTMTVAELKEDLAKAGIVF